MTSNESLTASQIITALRKQQDALKRYKVTKIGLFGSYATGRQTRQSDIDFLVEFEEPTFDNFMGLCEYLENLFGRKVDLITNGSLSRYIQPYVEKEIEWHDVQ